MTPRRTPALLHPFARPAAEPGDFITLVRGEGASVVDAQGRRYVDAMASLWHCNVGHGRPEVAAAVAAQLAELETFHCFEKFGNLRAEELAARLADLAPVPGSRVFLTSGGSRRWTPR
jgi:adenosylmethionine-8-amino-7-oxononanoate aminotransferase